MVHCHSQAEAEKLLEDISARLQECLLTMHPDKSKIVYCKDSSRKGNYLNVTFTFLGFTFKPRVAVSRQGKRFTSFLPGVSKDAIKGMRQKVKEWNLNRQVPANLEQLALKYNAVIRGWWNYYGSFYKTEMRKLFDYLNQRLVSWARRKYKNLKCHKQRGFDWLSRIAVKQPMLFHHWKECRGMTG